MSRNCPKRADIEEKKNDYLDCGTFIQSTDDPVADTGVSVGDAESICLNLEGTSSRPYTVSVNVNGVAVVGLIDSGACLSVWRPKIAEQLALDVKPSKVRPKGVSGETLKTTGEFEVQLELHQKDAPLKVIVLDQELNLQIGGLECGFILGRNFIEAFGL